MRDKLNTLSLSALRDIAKVNKIKNVSVMRKNDLIEVILATLGEASEVESKEKTEARFEEKENTGTPIDSVVPINTPAPANAQIPVNTPALLNPSAPVNTFAPLNTPVLVNTQAQPSTHASVTAPVTSQASVYVQSPQSQVKPQVAAYIQSPVDTQVPTYTQNPTFSQAPTNSQVQSSQQPHQSPSQPQEVHTIEKPKMETNPNLNIDPHSNQHNRDLIAEGILEVLAEGYGFIRCENFLPGENDVYVSPAQIRKFGLKTGDVICGSKKLKSSTEKFSALYNINIINGKRPDEIANRPAFEKLTPIFPNERIHLEPNSNGSIAMRIVDLISPIGKGQRGMIVSQPKAGKTTLLKQIARAVTKNNPEMHLIILLIDERPEEVTDIKESIEGKNVEVIYSTFDELPERHKRVSEMVIERAKRLVEQKEDVMILLDSITRLTRAYNLTVQASGRTLSGGLDPAALYMPKRFFGAARKMREGGSLTILATALVDTGSKMDDIVFEEFKGTGNMELVLDRKLSEKRVFPAIDIAKSGTRREDLLMTREELEGVDIMRKALNGMKSDDAVDKILNMFAKTRNNAELLQMVNKSRII